jgi:hypothetical protein
MRKLLVVVLLFFSLNGLAQESYSGPENTKVEMADGLRAEGKIYVVVAVLTTLLAGMIVYAVLLDRRITKLEHKSNK